MPIQTQDVDYSSDAATLRGYLAFDDSAAERRPGVLVFHEGLGLGDFAMARARMLAELGYVALAADMFGGRRQARNLQEIAEFVGDLRSQPETLRGRGRAALARLAALPQVDTSRLAAVSTVAAVQSGPDMGIREPAANSARRMRLHPMAPHRHEPARDRATSPATRGPTAVWRQVRPSP